MPRFSSVNMSVFAASGDGKFYPEYPNGNAPSGGPGAQLQGSATAIASASGAIKTGVTFAGVAASVALALGSLTTAPFNQPLLGAATSKCTASGFLVSAATGGYDGVIKRSGNTLVNGAGIVTRLVGANMSALEFVGIQQFGNVSSWGGVEPAWNVWATWKPNVVRIPLNDASFRGLSCQTAHGNPATSFSGTVIKGDPQNDYIPTLDAGIAAAQAIGCYVILDLHWCNPTGVTLNGVTANIAPDGQPMFMPSNANTFWEAIAARYGTAASNQPGISNAGIIFELANEPYMRDDGFSNNAALWAFLLNGGTVTKFAWAINAYSVTPSGGVAMAGYQTMLNAIRLNGSTNVILVAGDNFSQNLTGFASWVPTDSANQIGFAWHPYPSGNYPYVDGNIFGAVGDDPGAKTISFDQSAKAILAAGYPLVITEDGGQDGSACIMDQTVTFTSTPAKNSTGGTLMSAPTFTGNAKINLCFLTATGTQYVLGTFTNGSLNVTWPALAANAISATATIYGEPHMAFMFDWAKLNGASYVWWQWNNPQGSATGTTGVTTASGSITGTATSGSTTTVVDTSQSWATNVWAGATVTVGSHSATITSNTATTLTCGNLTTAVASGNAYAISSVVIDTSKSWTANQWAGYHVTDLNTGLNANIVSNTSNMLVCNGNSDIPISGDSYLIGNYNNNYGTTGTQSSPTPFQGEGVTIHNKMTVG